MRSVPSRAPLAALIVGLAALVVAACTADPGPAGAGDSTSTAIPADARYYVSVGDSYAAGYQPTSKSSGGTSRNGFAYLVAASGGWQLANFGCSGVTAAGALDDNGCVAGALGPGGIAYPNEPQVAAAERFLRQHQGHVALVTVILGGNDLRACLSSTDPQPCFATAVPALEKNLATIAQGLRAAAGATVPIVGMSYPDVMLGDYLTAAGKEVAAASIGLFRSDINPAMAAAYRSADATFVDTTALTGAYASADQTSTLAPYGSLPQPVYDICRYTFICEYGDVHPQDAGYQLIARAVLETRPAPTTGHG